MWRPPPPQVLYHLFPHGVCRVDQSLPAGQCETAEAGPSEVRGDGGGDRPPSHPLTGGEGGGHRPGQGGLAPPQAPQHRHQGQRQVYSHHTQVGIRQGRFDHSVS